MSGRSEWGAIAAIVSAGLMLGMLIGGGIKEAQWRSSAIKAGVGQYNPQTAAFEWKKSSYE